MEKAGGQSDELATVRIKQLQEKLDAAEGSRKASETAEQEAKRREQRRHREKKRQREGKSRRGSR